MVIPWSCDYKWPDLHTSRGGGSNVLLRNYSVMSAEILRVFSVCHSPWRKRQRELWREKVRKQQEDREIRSRFYFIFKFNNIPLNAALRYRRFLWGKFLFSGQTKHLCDISYCILLFCLNNTSFEVSELQYDLEITFFDNVSTVSIPSDSEESEFNSSNSSRGGSGSSGEDSGAQIRT